MPKRGNWGDRAVIDLPPLSVKKVSCYACANYIREDGSCLKTANIPKNDGKDIWRKCQFFQLATEYMNYTFMEQVKAVKGRNFFENKIEQSKDKEEKRTKELIERVSEKIDIRKKVICDKPKANYSKIQFNSKSAKYLRIILAKYYSARKYNEKEMKEQLMSRGCLNEQLEEIIRNCRDWIKKRIDNSLVIVPISLIDSFVSVKPEEFAIELATFFYENGIETATNINCQIYCEAIHAYAINSLINNNGYVDSLPKDIEMKKKIVFLDALTNVMAESKVISPNKYEISADYFIHKMNN